jgi:drug/metabolite transporter (DMT)-like permease
MIILFAVPINKEKLTVKKVVCVILAVIGVYIIIGGIDGNGQILGILISICSVILWSFASVTVRRVTQKYDPFQITTYGIIGGFIFSFPVAAYELMTTGNVQFDFKVILSLIYMGLICTALAHVLWNKSLSILEASTCSLFYPVQPMVAGLLGWMFLREDININFIVGAVLIIGGVLTSIVNKRKLL